MVARIAPLLAVVSLGLLLADRPARAQEQGQPQPGLGRLFGGEPARDARGVPELDSVEAQLRTLARRGDAGPARAAIERGLLAVADARREAAAGRAKAAERKQQIAWAALSLAGRQIAAAQASQERDAAERRARTAQDERDAARHALEQARTAHAAGHAAEHAP